MKWRSSLYVRLFIGFWLMTIGILGSWVLAARYFDSLPGDVVEIEPDSPPPRFVLRLIYQLQDVPDAELSKLIRDQHRHGMDVYLLDSAGEDILDRTVPEIAQLAASKLGPEQNRVFLHQDRKPPVTAYTIHRPGQGPLKAVLTPAKRHGHSMLRALGDKLWLRTLLAITVSGLFCYFLSRLMTRRLDRLRDAAGQLATGNLSARIPVADSGGDEADDLARTFNTMAEQLQRRIDAQKRLLSDVSHELRSPLARMKLAIALAQQQPQQSATQLDRLERETGRLEELIAQLLSTQAGRSTLDEHIDLAILLRELCIDADFEARATDKAVSYDEQVEQAIVATRDDLLRKVLENILRNAVQYTATGTDVEVTLTRHGMHYEIQVSDCGPGIPEDELEQVFEAFYRVDTARARDTGGYGLGLSIARRGVEQHGGSIRADNTGNGLRVVITLPAADALDD